MKKFALLLPSFLFFINLISAQVKAIKITNETAQKEKIIKENKRVKVFTVDGGKLRGRFKIEADSILIQGERINLSDIMAIKRNPLLVSIVTGSFLVYVGSITIGLGVLIGVLVDSSAFLLTIPGAGLIYAGLKPPNFSKKFKIERNWTFEIIVVSD
ncbi:MAG: hypothetical protein KDD26_11910 [Winogradskyella sp.]|nr:hypothetical protein [Winogradskyella sp.]